ncbi:hypothetical protein CSB37_02215 [bacterium DOLZORAL124_38_8]|nr:MAG: hypothetical protein CSB37_02215 [bacterium DOLZORAL124_38_8]
MPKNLSPTEIETLVQQVQAGDTEQFGILFEHFYDKIFRFVSFRVNQNEAEDIVSDIFLKIVQKINSYAPNPKIKQSFAAWIFRIAQNTVIDFYRKQKEYLGLTDDEGEDKFLLEDPHDTPDEGLQKQYQQQEIKKILTNLSPIHAQVLELRYMEDFSYREMADILQKSEGNIRIIHMRALREIRKKFPKPKSE